MKVKICDLHPNPFRDIGNYPINQEKVESLACSIQQTGFWDNILARKKNGKIQIAYGHHRLVILQRDFKPDHIVDIPVKELDDATMIKIMANENMQEWGVSLPVIDETIKITKKFLEDHLDVLNEFVARATISRGYEKISARIISAFLGKNWSEYTIKLSLQRQKLIAEEVLDKQAIMRIPHEKAATYFTRSVKRLKDVTPDQQRKAAEKIVESQDFGRQSVQKAIMEEKYPHEEKEAKEKEFAEFIEECSKLMNILNRKLETLIKFKSDFDSAVYKRTFARFEFDGAINMLQINLKELIKEDK